MSPAKTPRSPRLEAAERGQTHYEGRPCSICGATLRYTTTRNCVACTKTRAAEERVRVRDLMERARASASGE